MDLENFDLSRLWQPLFDFVVKHYAALLASSLILIGAFLLNLLLRLLIRPWEKQLTPQAMMILRKAISYLVTALVVITVLQQFGVKLTGLLGAAGIAGIAIGLAAQTSLSNIISGGFLIWEKSFQVGDSIRVGEHTGVVESIDLLSMTLRTFDNLSIRLPNESLVKSEVINITRYPIRRFDVTIGVGYGEDPERVVQVLRRVADQNVNVLEEPEPLIGMSGFGESELKIFIGVWHEKEDYLKVRHSILRDIWAKFREENIEIPYPHRVLIQANEGLPLEEENPGAPTSPSA
jgi:small-conductance mechanosensitive channel